MNPLDLTIVIPTKNEQQNLPNCLNAIGLNFAKQIILLDSNSTDSTVKIAENFSVEVINFQWNGKFPKKRNWYLENHIPKTKWVLFLDADEYLTEDFKTELRKTLPNSNVSGYWLNYTIYFLGKKLKGGYPLRKLALFQSGSGFYEKIEENKWSHLDMEVHEHPIIKGHLGAIKSKIDHQDFRGISEYIKKHNEYSDWEAKRFIHSSNPSQIRTNWTFIQKVKYQLIRTPLIGIAYFCGSFVLMGGFRDGARGLAFAIMKMSYYTQIYCKIKELQSKNTRQ